MKSYAANILPTDPSKYTLHGATFVDKQLVFSENGGTASVLLAASELKQMTEYYRLNVIAKPMSDPYDPTVAVRISARQENGSYFAFFSNVTADETGSFSTELELTSATFEYCKVEFTTTGPAVLSLWELRPESSSDIETIIDGVKQSLPRLLYDFNVEPLEVQQKEKVVAIIPCFLIKGTDLQGHLLINVYASTRCNVYLRIFDGLAEELYCPIKRTLEAGLNNIALPHAYLHKTKGAHNFIVTLQCSNGLLRVDTRGILYTIDGGYLAQRVSNPGMDIMDISARHQAAEKEPTEIWGIGIDYGKAYVKRCAYEEGRLNNAWEGVQELGEAKKACLEFDGRWMRQQGLAYSSLITDDQPMIAIVDSADKLQIYMPGATAPSHMLAEKVTSVSMIRGFSSEEFPEQNQGMIIAWIAEGRPYYQQFLKEPESKWLPKELLEDRTDALFIQVHRLNDYRIGILVQYKEANIWYITDRTYVAQAIPTELVMAELKEKTAVRAQAIGDRKYQLTEAVGLSSEQKMSLFAYDSKLNALLTFECEANDLSGAVDPQADFIVHFTGVSSIMPESMEVFLQGLIVKHREVLLTADQYEVCFSGLDICIHLLTPITGTLAISWKEQRFKYYLDDTHFVYHAWSAQTFTWSILKYTVASNSDAVQCSMQASSQARAQPIAYNEQTYDEAVVAGFGGTSTYTAQQISDIPI